MLTKIDDIVDELYYEIMVGPEAFEVMPLVKVVLDRLAVSFRFCCCGCCWWWWCCCCLLQQIVHGGR